MIQKAIQELLQGSDLQYDTAKTVMHEMMDGTATQAQMGAFLAALRMKGETVEEITACAQVMREKGLKIKPVRKVIDIVGTGGDGTGTFNISTTAAFVTAAGGVPVAKHGNRGVSSRCGAADVLEELGININLSAAQTENILQKSNMCFMFAPLYHTSMKYAAPVRREMGVRTIFNILGPLSNPAGAKMQLMGVYNQKLVEPLARVLMNLGVTRGLCVCGSDGMDEVTLAGETHICEIRNGTISQYDITPEQFGFKRCSMEDLKGGDPKENAVITENILTGTEKGAKRDVVVLNAAMAIYLSKDDCPVSECIKIAQDLIDSGKAMNKLHELRMLSNEVFLN
ncbi:MAG: anthranilate phosphoribosyltransferase [Ruminiclostridium sp.]|nr:anthranilate phosphoribosyltransferase [Ruminiclostridium sp.]